MLLPYTIDEIKYIYTSYYHTHPKGQKHRLLFSILFTPICLSVIFVFVLTRQDWEFVSFNQTIAIIGIFMLCMVLISFYVYFASERPWAWYSISGGLMRSDKALLPIVNKDLLPGWGGWRYSIYQNNVYTLTHDQFGITIDSPVFETPVRYSWQSIEYRFDDKKKYIHIYVTTSQQIAIPYTNTKETLDIKEKLSQCSKKWAK